MAEERVRRRLAAILVADVVGYSRLIEADEEGTRTRIRSLHAEVIDPRVAADGGRIVKTSGDGVLVEFPSAVDAVRNALAIQTAMSGRNDALPEDRQIMFRVGINIGDVIVEGDDIHGDGVNVAARLEGLCGPGEVYASGAVYDQAAGKLPVSFEDLGERTVKNIAKPIRTYRVRAEREETDNPQKSKAADTLSSLPDKPSIAVLPFDNLSGDPEQEYFSDGMSEDIITALSRIGWLFVTARNSSFSYKGQSPDLRDVAKDLNVRYVLEGSVRKVGDRIRVSVQLIDGATGNHIWAERYDRDLHDIFALQDEITATVVGAIEPELAQAELQRAIGKHPDNIDAWDLHQRGMHAVNRQTPESMSDAEHFFRQAIELEPDLAAPHAGLSTTLGMMAFTKAVDDQERCWEEAVAEGRRAVELDRGNVTNYWGLGVALATLGCTSGDFQAAVQILEQGLAINPNSALIRANLGRTLAFAGRAPEGIEHIEAALRLSPRDVAVGRFMTAMGIAQFASGAYEVALEWFTKAQNAGGGNWVSHGMAAMRVAALAHLARDEAAKAECATLAVDYPNIVQMVDEYRVAFRDDLIDGLKKAGLEGL